MDDISLFETAKGHYRKLLNYHSSVNYNAGLDHIWSNNMRDIDLIVSGARSATELIDKVDQTFMYSINFPPENSMNTGVWTSPGDQPHIRNKQIDWLLARQKADGLDLFSLPDNIQESEFVHDRNKVLRNDRTLTGNFLRTLSITHRISSHIKEEIKSVLELGGGTGHQARTFILRNPGVKYTIVDLPETLIFSFTYISLNFPDKKILFITSEEDAARVDEYDYVFCPSIFAPHLHGRSYDLFINTASMGEMNNQTIHRWMDFIQNRVNFKYLFTLNRFLNVVNDGYIPIRIHCNECSVSYDKKWDILQWELEPVYCRCPYIDTLHSRYVEIIAERLAEEPSDVVERSNFYYQDAQDEDWWRLRGQFGDGVMQARNNVLVNDTTMTGTLFKLWESIRLHPHQGNVDLMLTYMSRITVGDPFEEKFYFERLLRTF